MTASPAPARSTQAPALTALDARTLGRPVHLLGRFSEQLRDDAAELLRSRFNLRYRATFEVVDVSMECARHAPAEGAWRVCGEGPEAIFCALDRDLVLSVMAYRYGLRAALSATGEAPRETATEERLAAQLADQFTALLAARIDAGIGTRLPDEPPPLIGSTAPAAPPPRAWSIEAVLRERAHGIAGSVRFVLGEARMARLWHALAPLRSRSALPEHAVPLGTQLAFRLVARLLHKEMPLGDLAELRVGDVIPISLGATEVLIDDARLFTAAVAEHQGKLCLTSFADVE